MQTFILKFSDRMPIIIGMNEQSSKRRFALNVANNEALADTDAENSYFSVLDGNIFMVDRLWMCHPAPDKRWQTIVPFGAASHGCKTLQTAHLILCVACKRFILAL